MTLPEAAAQVIPPHLHGYLKTDVYPTVDLSVEPKSDVAPTADFEGKWRGRDYLGTYYNTEEVAGDERLILDHVGEFLKQHPEGFRSYLEIGAGPTIHHATVFAEHAQSMTLSDYIPNNLEEIRLWLEQSKDAFDWSVYLRGILAAENGGNPVDEAQIQAREALVRGKIKLEHCNIQDESPMGNTETHDLVTSFYCADSVANTPDEWEYYMDNIVSLVSPGGYLIISALLDTVQYKVMDDSFPSANISEQYVLDYCKKRSLTVIDNATQKEEEWTDNGIKRTGVFIIQKAA